jgi:hypothetical protein
MKQTLNFTLALGALGIGRSDALNPLKAVMAFLAFEFVKRHVSPSTAISRVA